MSATPSLSSPRARDKAHPYASPRVQRSLSSASRNSHSKPHTASHPMHPPTTLRTPLPIHTDPRTPSPNYFGLAFDASTDVFSSNDKNLHSQWSPPNSNVRSTAAASPRIIPVEANPEFAQFRKQSENSKFTLGRLHSFEGPATTQKPANLAPSPISPKKDHPLSPRPASAFTNLSSIEVPEKPRSPKRLLSDDPDTVFPDRQRRNSPASFTGSSSAGSGSDVPFFSPNPNRSHPPAAPLKKTGSSFIGSHSRAETLPTNIDDERNSEGPVMITPQRVVNLLESAEEEILILDLRVWTQYGEGKIFGALSLCIPTMLIKRPSHNVAKLAETFKDEESRRKFEKWRSSKYIIVYDADSQVIKDATNCVNTLKKFAGEGWNGSSYIIRGGYSEFSAKFPNWVMTSSADPASRNSSVSSDAPAPETDVFHGCPLPAEKNAANPFFGNIRQNMDLIGGVGQMPLKRPAAMTKEIIPSLPSWLDQAIVQEDEGKLVSDKFLHIEKGEQRRMQEALSGEVTYGTPGPESSQKVRIAGIEKGSKNRYNNIWVYEHSRVKLEGVPNSGCDYVNASHIQSERSNKRYIATQAPIPATFNDFWNVVWQQGARVIVMLTAQSEGGQVKAHNYWEGRDYGHLRLNFLSEHRASLELSRIHQRRNRSSNSSQQSDGSPGPKLSDSPAGEQPYVIVRKFTLSHSDYPFERMREITQLQYSSWPDFGAPAHPAHLLGLVEQCDSVVRASNGIKKISAPEPANSRPVIVHCSAGCGRTGTFCTVDSVIDMLRAQREETRKQRAAAKRQSFAEPMDVDINSEVDSFFGTANGLNNKNWLKEQNVDLIEKTVEEFRHQRLSMVQSLRQFVLCYETVLEWMVGQDA